MPTDALETFIFLLPPPSCFAIVFVLRSKDDGGYCLPTRNRIQSFLFGVFGFCSKFSIFFKKKIWPQTINHSGTAGVFYYVPAPGMDSLRYATNLLDTCSGYEAT